MTIMMITLCFSRDLMAIQDNRDVEYFIKLLHRKEEAVSEYSIIQKAI